MIRIVVDPFDTARYAQQNGFESSSWFVPPADVGNFDGAVNGISSSQSASCFLSHDVRCAVADFVLRSGLISLLHRRRFVPLKVEIQLRQMLQRIPILMFQSNIREKL